MAQTKSTMNLGTLVALATPRNALSTRGRDIACSENDELICI